MFPGEGSIYLWPNKAFGTFWGFFAGFCAWWPGVLVMVATGTIVFSFLGYVFPDSIGTLDIRVQGIVITAFIVFSAVISILRFRVTQNIVNVVFVLYGRPTACPPTGVGPRRWSGSPSAMGWTSSSP